jgi:hypothetical protein
MTLISSSVPGLLGGVSQQPSSVRFPNQAEASDNALASVVDGLIKRPPTENIAKVIAGDPGIAKVHTIDRGVGERYGVILRNTDVSVFDLTTGAEVQVYDSADDEADASDFAYLTSSDPVADFRAVTVADYTFVLNSQKTTALGSGTNAAEAERAFLFVQQSAYEVDYKVFLKGSADSVEQSVDITTWDGSDSNNVAERRRINITSASEGDWSGSVLGTTFSYSYSDGTPSTTEIGNALRAVIGGIQGVSTSGSGDSFYVDCDHEGLDQRLVLDTAPAQGGLTGGWSQTVITNDSETEKNSLKTSTLASQLASDLDALTNWTATAQDSTVKLEPSSGTIESIRVEDSAGNTYLRRIYRSVDAITELPLTCQDGHVIKVNGEKSSNQDDYYLKFAAEVSSDFGPGRWEECAAPGINTGLDADTMPHSLVRKFDDVSGTVTGTPSAKYFTWAPFTWTDRVAGDAETNPSPTFVGKTIRGLFLHQNRLGLLSDQNVIMSETGLYGNFWRTTVLTLVDSDVIDIGVGHTRVSLLNHAIPFNQRLYLFSDRTQFVINQSPMTPSNTTVVTTAEYENSITVGGVSSGNSIFFPFKTESYGRILEMYPTGESPTSVEVLDATKHVPRYMDGEIRTLSGSTTESLLVATSSNRPNVLYVMSYFEQGKQRIQSAWQRFVFGADTTILWADFIEENLYLMVKRSSSSEEGVFLEKMTFGSGIVDADSTFRVALDRRIKDTDCTVAYSLANDQTTVTLPYNQDPNETYQVVSRAVNGKSDAFNLMSNEEDFSAWTASGVTVTSNSTEAPDGETTADSAASSGSGSDHIKQEVAQAAVIDDYYTWSVHIQKDTSTLPAKIVLELYNVATATTIEKVEFSMDTSTGVLSLTGSMSQGPLGEYDASVLGVTLEDGWWRIKGTLKYFAVDGSGYIVTGTRMTIYPSANPTAKTVVLWGAQLLKNDVIEDYNRQAGIVYGLDSASTNSIVVKGDLSTTPFWVGEKYLMQHQFSEINLKENSATKRGKSVVADAEYYLRHGMIMFDNTGYFRVIVKPKHRDATSQPFTTTVLGKPEGLKDGRSRFGLIGKAEDLKVYIENDSPLPSNLLGVEWTALYNSKSARYAI